MLLHSRQRTLHGVRNKSLKLGKKNHSKEADKYSQENQNQAEMAESEGIQAIANQAAIQTVTAVMMALRHADVGKRTTANTASPTEPLRWRHGGSVLEKPLFNQNAQERYMELLNFELEVTNIL